MIWRRLSIVSFPKLVSFKQVGDHSQRCAVSLRHLGKDEVSSLVVARDTKLTEVAYDDGMFQDSDLAAHSKTNGLTQGTSIANS